jgi:hypothetical protein
VNPDLLREHAYLVERGVRPLALIGNCSADPGVMFTTISRLKRVPGIRAVPFVVPDGSGEASYGYAASAWAVDCLRWVLNDAPEAQRHRFLGILLGYSPAIREHEEYQAGDPLSLSGYSQLPLDVLLTDGAIGELVAEGHRDALLVRAVALLTFFQFSAPEQPPSSEPHG